MRFFAPNTLLQQIKFDIIDIDQKPIINNINDKTIGILDMSGFENFSKDTFEQLCINLANEHIQNYFNEKIFVKEQQEYVDAAITLKTFNFQNNTDLISLFMGVCLIGFFFRSKYLQPLFEKQIKKCQRPFSN
jgi:hypothetical protein